MPITTVLYFLLSRESVSSPVTTPIELLDIAFELLDDELTLLLEDCWLALLDDDELVLLDDDGLALVED